MLNLLVSVSAQTNRNFDSVRFKFGRSQVMKPFRKQTETNIYIYIFIYRINKE